MKEITVSLEDHIFEILTLRAQGYGVTLEEFVESALIEGALVTSMPEYNEGAH